MYVCMCVVCVCVCVCVCIYIYIYFYSTHAGRMDGVDLRARYSNMSCRGALSAILLREAHAHAPLDTHARTHASTHACSTCSTCVHPCQASRLTVDTVLDNWQTDKQVRLRRWVL